ncbi:MAG: PIN domain-containing protein [Pseudomonadota bacterium]
MSAPKRPFFDTNVVVCLTSGQKARAEKAEELIAKGGVISVQVLNEVASVARRKIGLSWIETREVLDALKANLDVAPLTLSVHDRAIVLAEADKINIYDACIVAAAQENSCDAVLSEDMQRGRKFGAVTVRNPFLDQV